MLRYDQRLRKIKFWDWILHFLGIHLVRTSNTGSIYCRICGKVFNEI